MERTLRICFRSVSSLFVLRTLCLSLGDAEKKTLTYRRPDALACARAGQEANYLTATEIDGVFAFIRPPTFFFLTEDEGLPFYSGIRTRTNGRLCFEEQCARTHLCIPPPHIHPYIFFIPSETWSTRASILFFYELS